LVMSARPGRIIAEFDIPFEYPRTEDLRYTGEFAALTGAINHALRDAHV
jgi:NitT/TauT family transport system ATP-binding protein